MAIQSRLLFVIGISTSLILTILGIYTTIRSRSLHLPLPSKPLLMTLSILLPISQFLFGPIIYLKFASNTTLRNALIPLITLISLLETFLLSVSANFLTTGTLRTCILQGQWLEYFKTKNARAIRDVQDMLDCCGFRSGRDMAWPFPSNENGRDAGACLDMYPRRSESCVEGWESEMSRALGFLVVIGGVGLVYKLTLLIWTSIENPDQKAGILHLIQSAIPARRRIRLRSGEEDQNGGERQRLLERGDGYVDEENAEERGENADGGDIRPPNT